MMHTSFYRRIVFPFLILLMGGSCSLWKQPNQGRPNIILFSVEALNFERLSCGEPLEATGGFSQLCSRGLRFTHFFSPSTLSQAAMASLLTGIGPSAHHVVDNGASSLVEILQTVPEKALTVGYNTAFFSGGPPLLCKSGLQQGFEVCDDEFLSSEASFRSVQNNFERAQSWIKEQSGPFFLNLYAPDTQFYNRTTTHQDGKERAKTFESQIDEIDESLGVFFDWLKKEKYWDNTVIIITGLNGESLALRSVTWRENVFAENVHTPLFIQLPYVEKGESRSIDTILTHADVGRFILGLLDSPRARESFELYVDSWLGQLPKFIEIRSDWQSWWFGLPPVVSLRTEDYLVFPTKKLVIYHSVADPSETLALSENQVASQDLAWLNFRVDQSFDTPINSNSEMHSFLREVNKQRPDSVKNILEQLRKKSLPSGILETLTTDILLEQGDWEKLKEHISPAVEFVAHKNLGVLKIPQLLTACEKLFYGRYRLNLIRNCNDSLLLALVSWEKHIQNSDSIFWEKRFIRKYRFYRQYKHLAYRNLFIDLNWHVDNSRLIGPSLTDLYLRLPGKERLRQRISFYSLPEGLNFLYE